jgi:hypothetical protein
VLSGALTLHWFIDGFGPHDSPVVLELPLPPRLHALSLGALVAAFAALLAERKTYEQARAGSRRGLLPSGRCERVSARPAQPAVPLRGRRSWPAGSPATSETRAQAAAETDDLAGRVPLPACLPALLVCLPLPACLPACLVAS